MSLTIQPGSRSGFVRVPSSKSQLHRLLILAAFGTRTVRIERTGFSDDVSATAACLNALGAHVTETEEGFSVEPFPRDAEGRLIRTETGSWTLLSCAESGATLRFMIPLAGLFGRSVALERNGRLAERPIEPLADVLRAHGMEIREDGPRLFVSGKLTGGVFALPGNISSQFVTALLLTLPFLEGDSVLRVGAPVESSSYIALTEQMLGKAGIAFEKADLAHQVPREQAPARALTRAVSEDEPAGGAPAAQPGSSPSGPALALVWDPLYWIPGGQTAALPEQYKAEGDFSAAAVFLCIGALSAKGMGVFGLQADTVQGDQSILDFLHAMGAEMGANPDVVAIRGNQLKGITVDAAQVPDLVPVLAVTAAAAQGDTIIQNARRLRLKESDRLESTAALIRALGGSCEIAEGTLIVHGGQLHGGQVSAGKDHRIAMAAAVAACAADGPVTLDEPECVSKSYAAFWRDFGALQTE